MIVAFPERETGTDDAVPPAFSSRIVLLLLFQLQERLGTERGTDTVIMHAAVAGGGDVPTGGGGKG